MLLTEILGNQISQLRKYRGLTQEQLAQKTGLTRQTIILIELGKTNFQVETLVLICRELNVIIDTRLTPAENLEE